MCSRRVKQMLQLRASIVLGLGLILVALLPISLQEEPHTGETASDVNTAPDEQEVVLH